MLDQVMQQMHLSHKNSVFGLETSLWTFRLQLSTFARSNRATKRSTPHTLKQVLSPLLFFNLLIQILSISLQFNLFSTKWKGLMGQLTGKSANEPDQSYLNIY